MRHGSDKQFAAVCKGNKAGVFVGWSVEGLGLRIESLCNLLA